MKMLTLDKFEEASEKVKEVRRKDDRYFLSGNPEGLSGRKGSESGFSRDQRLCGNCAGYRPGGCDLRYCQLRQYAGEQSA